MIKVGRSLGLGSLIVVGLMLGVFGAACFAADFSADFVVKSKGEDEIAGKILVKGQKIRQEIAEGEDKQILIIRPDKGVTWMLTTEDKSYMEIPYESQGQAFDVWTAESEKLGKLLGEETVAGYPCKKFELVEEGEKATYWVSKKLAFPIKVQDSESVMEYKNIKEGAVDDALFEVPQGFEKLALPAMPQIPVMPEKEGSQ
jgi:outer membrane lipoprotein-sorting protein